LRAPNFEGYQIYIRPADCSFVLIDLDTDPLAAIQQMKADKLPIWLIVESSPGKRQVWTSVGRRGEVTKHEAHECARLLARKYGGDPGSAKAFQLGRAPGFYNRKPAHRDAKGWYPLVKARGTISTRIAHDVISEARKAVSSPSPHPRSAPVHERAFQARETDEDWFQQNIKDAKCWIEFRDEGDELFFRFTMPNIRSLETAYRDLLDHMIERCGYVAARRADGDVDRSNQDFHVAKTMLMLGYGEVFTATVINAGSGKAASRGPSNDLLSGR
jgi:hypothetical protein